jgi:hypothetical protein
MVGLVTRRDGVIGLVVVALCLVGFFLSRPHFAAAHPSDEHVIDRRSEERLDNRSTHRVRTVRYVRSDLRIVLTNRFEPDHYVAADLGDLTRSRLAQALERRHPPGGVGGSNRFEQAHFTPADPLN